MFFLFAISTPPPPTTSPPHRPERAAKADQAARQADGGDGGGAGGVAGRGGREGGGRGGEGREEAGGVVAVGLSGKGGRERGVSASDSVSVCHAQLLKQHLHTVLVCRGGEAEPRGWGRGASPPGPGHAAPMPRAFPSLSLPLSLSLSSPTHVRQAFVKQECLDEGGGRGWGCRGWHGGRAGGGGARSYARPRPGAVGKAKK